MTIVYRPVLIETAEQAGALPEGTLVFAPFEPDPELMAPEDVGFRWANLSIKYGDTWVDPEQPGTWTSNEYMVGFTALVPIEVKEESRGAIVRLQRTDDAPWGPDEEVEYRIDDYGVSSWEAISEGRIYGQDITGEMEEWLSAQPKETRFVTPWEKS